MSKVFIVGYPGDAAGANTELWHLIQLWRKHDVPLSCIPAWGTDKPWEDRLNSIGVPTIHTKPDDLKEVSGLSGSIVVSLCNGEFLKHANKFRDLGCKLVWVNCMTWLFPDEKEFCQKYGPFEAHVFHTDFQRKELEAGLSLLGYSPNNGHTIHGAFDVSDWPYTPRPHKRNEDFLVGRVARPDPDKWSSNTWKIYSLICYPRKRALMLGADKKTLKKIGTPPPWADCLSPRAIPAQLYFSSLHCTMPINGGARENWPRAGLEAMAIGVPIVAQNSWGWREMIEHGVTGFLGTEDEELAHYASILAWDEDRRIKMAAAARDRLISELADTGDIWSKWLNLFQQLGYV